MRTRRHLLHHWTAVALVLSFAWAISGYAAEKNASYEAALESIRANEIGEYVGTLAGDAMEGREAGTKGGLAAAEYLAEEYRKLHMKGVGDDNGGFMQLFSPNFRNVLALLPGSDPKLRDEVIVVGGHYDHVGYGGRGSSRGPSGYVHPGADDNASGTTAALQVAKAFGILTPPPKRSILFAAWDAEEKGMLGSKHWAAYPTIPLERVKAVLNLDMVGRLRDDHLTVIGSRSGYGWRRLLSSQNAQANLQLDFVWGVKPNADYYSFFERSIPVLMFHTGLHDDYHRPADVASLINTSGMERLTRLLFRFVYEMANRPASPPEFREAASHETPDAEQAILAQTAKPGDRLGVAWAEDAATTGGIVVSDITPDSPAERAGILMGDCIVRFAGRTIRTDDDFYAAVTMAESPATVTVQRPDEEKKRDLKVELPGAPLRWGFVWRVDDAEPGAVILAHVVPGSPAAEAGLCVGDRIYQVGGRDFADEAAFAEAVKKQPNTLRLQIEREGRVQVMTLQSKSAVPIKRAA